MKGYQKNSWQKYILCVKNTKNLLSFKIKVIYKINLSISTIPVQSFNMRTTFSLLTCIVWCKPLRVMGPTRSSQSESAASNSPSCTWNRAVCHLAHYQTNYVDPDPATQWIRIRRRIRICTVRNIKKSFDRLRKKSIVLKQELSRQSIF